MDFKQTQQAFTQLKDQFEKGRITSDEFETRVNEMVVVDSVGDQWQIGVKTGKLYRFDGQGWVEDTPRELIGSNATYAPQNAKPYQARKQPSKSKWIGGLLIGGILVVCCMGVALGGWFIWSYGPSPAPFTSPTVSSLAHASATPLIPPATVVGPSTASPEPIASPGFDPGSPPFFDDFSNPASGWNRERIADYARDYENGSYLIQVNKINWTLTANPNKIFRGDVIIEVDAAKAGGPDKNGFGVICRFQDENNYYRFMISSDGLMVISMRNDGAWLNLSSDVWEPSDAIHQGTASNHLRAECIGDSLKLFINDHLAASATDSSFAGGDVGLTASAYDTLGVDILFDNFSATSR